MSAPTKPSFLEPIKSELCGIREEILELEPRLRALRKRESSLMDVLAAYGEEEERDGPPPFLIQTALGVGKYAELKGTSNAVQAVFKDHPGVLLTPLKITKLLTDGGYQIESPNLRAIVFNYCRRNSLGDDSIIEEVETPSGKAYRLKFE